MDRNLARNGNLETPKQRVDADWPADGSGDLPFELLHKRLDLARMNRKISNFGMAKIFED